MPMSGSSLYIGLMSGTSLDGIDGALVSINAGSTGHRIELLSSVTLPYPADEQGFLADVCGGEGAVSRITQANGLLAVRHAQAVHLLLKETEKAASEITAIGFHGQTVDHQPQAALLHGTPVRGTLQLGDPALLATLTEIDVISSFRQHDMAQGGEGAPLVPAFDFHFLASNEEGRAACNIGGIANLTFLPAGGSLEDVTAFDTGPGNVLINAAAELATSGKKLFDEDGRMARKGRINTALLNRMLEEPYYARPAPKSTGREHFNGEYIRQFISDTISGDDLVATMTALTARTIAMQARERWRGAGLRRMIVAGGGVHNPVLMEMIAAELNGIAVESSLAHGIDPDFKEAMAFAFLAWAFLNRLPGNVPSATGAEKAVVCGSFTPSPAKHSC